MTIKPTLWCHCENWIKCNSEIVKNLCSYKSLCKCELYNYQDSSADGNRLEHFHNVAISMCRTQSKIPQKTKQFDLKQAFSHSFVLQISTGSSYVPSMLDARNAIMDPDLFTHQTDICWDPTACQMLCWTGIQAYLVLLHFADTAFFFYKWKVCSHPALSKSIGTIFQKPLLTSCLCVIFW